jgi:hypothetical protein
MNLMKMKTLTSIVPKYIVVNVHLNREGKDTFNGFIC